MSLGPRGESVAHLFESSHDEFRSRPACRAESASPQLYAECAKMGVDEQDHACSDVQDGLYLAVIIDLFSWQMVGWSKQLYVKVELMMDAFRMA